MLYNTSTPESLNSPIRRKFVGTGFDKFMLGVSGTDVYGNQTGWGKAKGVVLPAVYGTLGAVGTTIAGLGPGVGAKFGSQLGSGINSLTGSFGSSLLKGTDGEDTFGQNLAKSNLQSQATAGILGEIGGMLGGMKLPSLSSTPSAVKPTTATQSQQGGGFVPLFNEAIDPLTQFKQGRKFNQYGQIVFKGGGEVPVWVKTLSALGQKGVTAYDGKVYDLSSLPADEPSTTRVVPKNNSLGMVTPSVLQRIANAEGSRYDQKNNVGPGHYGKYQFEPMLIQKYAGVSPEVFLNNPDLQELAMRRRLNDLRTEASTAINKTGSNLPLDDAMLLVHFKGLPTAMQEMRNPELMNKATKYNPSSNMYMRRRALGQNVVNQSPVGWLANTMQQMFKSGGEVIYDENDDTEDYFMVDKQTAQKAGLFDAVNSLAFGQGRYGERIFDQKSNLFMKNVLGANLPTQKKKMMLGEHVFAELKTHGTSQLFKGGGEVKKSELTPEQLRYLESEFGMRWVQTDPGVLRSSLAAAKMPYKEPVSVEKPKEKKSIGQAVVGAFQTTFGDLLPKNPSSSANGGNLSTNTPVDNPNSTPSRSSMLGVSGPEKNMSSVTPPPSLTSGGPSVTPASPTANPWMFSPTAIGEVTNAQRRMNQLGSSLLPNFTPIAQDGKWGQKTEELNRSLQARLGSSYPISPVAVAMPTPQGPKAMVTGVKFNDPKSLGIKTSSLGSPVTQAGIASTASRLMKSSIGSTGITQQNASTYGSDTLTKLGNIAGYLPDLGRIVAGAAIVGANQPKPFSLGNDYFRMKSEIENQRNQGLTPEQRGMFTNNLNTNYAAGAEALRNVMAGGASAGAMVAGLGRLGQQYQMGVANMTSLDAQQRQQNQAVWRNSVMQDLSLRQGLFNREEAIRAGNRNTAGALMGAAVENIQNRSDFNRQYGPGSQYDQMQQYVNSLYKQTIDTQAAQSEAFKRRLGTPMSTL